MDIPEEGRRMGTTPRWVGYVAVDDTDATADTDQGSWRRRLAAANGQQYRPGL